MKDEDGQPSNILFNAARRIDREVNELIGLCKGMLSDGVVNQAEAEFLASWLALNGESRGQWPASVLYARISSMLKDGRFDESEEKELLELLMKVAGGNATRLNAHSLTAGLPLTVPSPHIAIPGKVFCFTGKLLFATRSACEEHVLGRGGIVRESITRDLNYLVIGVVGSRDWIHSTFGRKIQKAVDYRERGYPVAIVPEEHFVRALEAR